jgi:glycosyltransferase involved in cell wall biosynthesis
MACGTPCVVTDVGDCDWIVGNTGVVVPAKNPNALVQGWQSLLSRLETEGAMLGKEARERIENQFSEHNLVEGTNATLTRLLSGVSVSN